MLLAIDAGNTRVKWGLFDENGFMQHHGAYLHADLHKMALPSADLVVISNVAGKQIADVMMEKLSKHENVKWIQAKQKACDVFNNYDKPETLGTDRWAALIAAWQMHHLSCIVVNAGTTVTIDVLIKEGSGAKFIGGVILPGIKVMHESLGQHTARLHTDMQTTDYLDEMHYLNIGLNTKNCIKSGVMAAILGAIKQITKYINATSQHPPIIVFSGGDAQLIQKQLATDKNAITNSMMIIDNLVLLGLLKLGQHA